MLSDEDRKFISKDMKISLESIESKLIESAVSAYRREIESAIAFFIQCIRKHNEAGNRCYDDFEDTPAEKEITQYYCERCEAFGETEAKYVLDSIWHAFCSFAYNGLHQLFTRQENEAWYPKIILDSELKPNDIDTLPEVVTIYRGTDKSEYISSKFGQSWTTKEEVAIDFAYRHYENQPWFEKENRIVLVTQYPRCHLYYSYQSCEYEVAVDTSKIGEVRKHT